MKKLVISAIAAMTLSTSAMAEEYDHQQPNETAIKMFLMTQNMTDEQEDLVVQLVHQVKSLASVVKAPKQEVTEYVKGLAEQDYIDVAEVMQKYKTWQQEVDKEFEQSLNTVAELHASMSVEQRKELMETIKKLRSN